VFANDSKENSERLPDDVCKLILCQENCLEAAKQIEEAELKNGVLKYLLTVSERSQNQM